MPRIPTRDNLRQSVPRSIGSVVNAPREFVGSAVRRAGARLLEAASSRAQAGQQETAERQRAALELATARSRWTSNLLAERHAFASGQSPDHDTWTRAYQARAGGLQAQAAGLISDPDVRRRFMAETQQDIERLAVTVDRQAREAGIAARRGEADRSLLQQVEIAASQPDEDAKSVMGGVRASLQDMVETGIMTAEEAASRSVGYARQYASLKAVRLARQDPALAVSMLNNEQPGPAMLIRRLHGFRPTPYWQHGTSRAGYGSDTITREDGTVADVTPGVTVARADAERDLQRRIEDVRSGIARQVGRKAFDRLGPHVQAALVSVGYSTGSLPHNVAAAMRSGNGETIAAAIESGPDADGGIADQIRREQAAIVRDADGRASERFLRHSWWADMLAPRQRAQLLDAAQREVGRADAAAALSGRTYARQLAQGVRSDIRSVYSTGGTGDVDPDEVLRELGPDKHRQWLATQQDAADVVAKTQHMPNLPDAEIRGLVAAQRLRPGDEDGGREEWIRVQVLRRAQDILRERRDNPARAALRIPSVRRALSEAQNPSTTSPHKVQALVRELAATQSALGVAGTAIAPLPDDWARAIGSALLASPTGPGSEPADGPVDAVHRAYAGVRHQFGEFADDVIAYSIARSAALRQETTGRVAGRLNSLSDGTPTMQQPPVASETA